MKINTRKIPATMVTQHPDHASKPYWHYKAYISTQYEAEEAYRSYAELGATEYKWDWEGKLVDESVVERLFGEYFSYFSKNPLGEEKFLTFRLPNPRIETEFRLGRAFITMATAASVAKHFGFAVPPIFEVILPMTETAEEMLSLQEAFQQIHSLNHPLYKLDGFLANLRVIPLFEKVTTIISSDSILKKYLLLYKRRFKNSPPYMRPYVARSDPALNSGIIPTVLSIKIALSRYEKMSKSLGIPLYPIIGCGSLPFRGGLTPERVEEFAKEYQGIRTVTLQSAFRYDFPFEKVKSATAYLENSLPLGKAAIILPSEEKQLLRLITYAEKEYQRTIEHVAPLINKVAAYIPKRRERFLHVGLFGYSRGEGKIKLPRAISFTCSLYSLGIPPELIGAGQAIAYAKKHALLPVLETYYVNLKKDLIESGKFLNKSNLKKISRALPAAQHIMRSVQVIEEYLGQELGPLTKQQEKHRILTEKILSGLSAGVPVAQLIKQAAVLRKSLG